MGALIIVLRIHKCVGEQQMTIRDDIWDEVLTEITRLGYVTVSDLPFNEEQRYSVRRTLSEMEQSGWLRRKSSHTSKWCLGEKAEDRLAVDRETILTAREVAGEE